MPAAYFEPCRLATTANRSLSGLSAIDGVTPVAGNRILVKAQTTKSQNGIWIAASGAWSRATDFSTNGVFYGTRVYVTDGTLNTRQDFTVITTGTITIGTTNIEFAHSIGDKVVTPGEFGSIGGGNEAAAIQAAIDFAEDHEATLVIDELQHGVPFNNPRVAMAVSPRKTTYPRGTITIPASLAAGDDWVEILEHIQPAPEQAGDVLFVTFEDGNWVFRDRVIKLPCPMYIRGLSDNRLSSRRRSRRAVGAKRSSIA